MTSPTIVEAVNGGPRQRVQGSMSGTYTAATDVNTTKNAGLAAGVLTITTGFQPTYVRVRNVTTRIQREWYTPMAKNTTLDTDVNGTQSLNVSSALVINGRTGAGGSNGGGGTAGASTDCTVVVTLSGFSTDNDMVVWEIEG